MIPSKTQNIDLETGMDELEQACMKGLMDAYSAWLLMDRQHPDELRDFVDSIHRLQDLIAVRVVRRAFPKGWPTYYMPFM